MNGGDTRPWRNIGHARWYDPYASLENPKSKAFKAAVAEENARWNAAISHHNSTIKRTAEAMDALYEAALPPLHSVAQEVFQWQTYTVKVQHGLGHRKNVWILDSADHPLAIHSNVTEFGVDPESSLYYTIRDIGAGAELLELQVYSTEYKTPRWSRKPVGPAAAFQDRHILYQTVENALRYPGIVMANARNGSGATEIYKETDSRYNVELLQPLNQQDLFVRIQNALAQRIGRIVGRSGITWLSPSIPHTADGKGTSLFPISATCYATNATLVIHGRHTHLPKGQSVTDAALVDSEHIAVVTTCQGVASLYTFDLAKKTFHPVYTGKLPNEIYLLQSSTLRVEITHPAKASSIYTLQNNTLKLVLKLPEPVALPYFASGFALSKDGTQVPYTYVSHYKHPKRLIVEGYGAYGISGHRSYPIHWLSWLKRGYALAVALPRGGREDGDAWYDGGRTALRKHNTFDDTAVVIQRVQSRCKLSPKRTVFYGRSAGGWLAAHIAQNHAHLVRAVYAEVPYLDVLRTTTNPALPLTQLEYDEFGNPAARPEEYNALRLLSPVDICAPAPLQAPFILVKSAVNDVQVLPYEALKWAKKLRNHGWNVLVGIDGDGGHFAAPDVMSLQQAQDMFLIDQALGFTTRGTRKFRSHMSMGTRRKRRSSLKHKNKHSTSPAAE